MAQDQKLIKSKIIIQPAYRFSHGHPCEMPEKIKKQPVPGDNVQHLEGEMRCTNWGCESEFQFDRNTKKECRFHPGRFEFGSEQGLWQEGWTCCRSGWEEPGCSSDNHKGYPVSAQQKACINHGEPNPKSKYPDSFCGKPFIYNARIKPKDRQDEIDCIYHPGYFRVKHKKSGDGVWTCCSSEERDGEPCTRETHKFAEWPDEVAKKYFFDKPLKVISDTWNIVQGRTDFEMFGRFSGLYRNVLPYVPKNPPRPP